MDVGVTIYKIAKGAPNDSVVQDDPDVFQAHLILMIFSLNWFNAQVLDVPFPDWFYMILCFNVFSRLRWFTNVNPRHKLPSQFLPSTPLGGTCPWHPRHERWDPSFAGNSHQATLRSILRMPLAIAAPWVLLARQGGNVFGWHSKDGKLKPTVAGDRYQTLEGKLLGPVQSYL